MRWWLVAIASASVYAVGAETSPFDSQSAVQAASTYLHSYPLWEHGLKLNYDEPHVFALAGQSGRRFISVGFDAYGDVGDLGGSYVVFEQCAGGKTVIVLPGSVSNFKNYRSRVTEILSGTIEVPRACR